ncbi:MAG: flagellar biosynthetic protein FliO [Pseudomonadota bacterium]
MKLKGYILGIILSLRAWSAVAAEPAALPYAPVSFLQVVLGLCLVLGLILASGWVLRKINPVHAENKLIRVVTATSVGQRERVVVVEINDNWLVLGVAPGQVNLLQSLPKAAQPVTEEIRTSTSFMDKVKEAAKRYGKS